MLDLRRLATFIAVAEEGSISTAARRLHLTQSAVSQQIAALEQELGQPLLHRRPLRLTGAGTMLLSHARQLLDQANYAEAELKRLTQSNTALLELGAFASACAGLLPPVIADFRRKCGDVTLILRQMEAQPAISALQNRMIDLALILDYNDIPPAGTDGLQRVFLLGEPLDVAIPAENELAELPELPPGKLNNVPWIEAPDAGLSLREIASALPRPPANELRYEGDSFDNVLALVAAEVGLALIPRFTVKKLPAGVVRRPLAGSPVTRNVYAYVRDGDIPAAANTMLDLLREHCCHG